MTNYQLTHTGSQIDAAVDLAHNAQPKQTGKGLSTNDYTTAEKTKLAGIETGAEVNIQSDWAQSDSTADDFIKNKPTLGSAASRSVVLSLSNAGSGLPTSGTVYSALTNKVDKVSGKDLSTNDYTDAEKTKLAGIETGANKTTVDSALSSSSTNPVQNQAVYAALNSKVDVVTGKQLSTEDYTTAEKTKLAGLNNYDDSNCVKYSSGTALVSGTDLNTIITIGAYGCTSGTVASGLLNCPYTASGFRLDVIETSTSSNLKQIIQPNQLEYDSSLYYRTYRVPSDAWSPWYKVSAELVQTSSVMSISNENLTNELDTSETI